VRPSRSIVSFWRIGHEHLVEDATVVAQPFAFHAGLARRTPARPASPGPPRHLVWGERQSGQLLKDLGLRNLHAYRFVQVLADLARLSPDRKAVAEIAKFVRSFTKPDSLDERQAAPPSGLVQRGILAGSRPAQAVLESVRTSRG